MTPLRIIADTASEAESMLSKMASIVLIVSLVGIRFTHIAVTIPKVPSEPTNTPRKSIPGVSNCLPPNQTILPPGKTTSIPRMWLTVDPCAKV